MKVACPHCSASRDVADDLADARVRCDQCGKRFSPHQALTENTPLELDGPDNEAGGGRSRVILFAACGGLVLLLASVAVGWFVSRPAKRNEPPAATAPVTDPKPDPNPPPAPKPQKPPGDGDKLTAASLLARFHANREKMAQRYDGATLTVTGKLGSPAERNPNGEVVLELAGSGTSGSRVWCRLDPKADTAAAKLPAETEVTLRGRCAGSGTTVGPFNSLPVAAEDVVLTECVLIGEPTLPVPPTLPTPDGVDYPKGITHDGIEVRITAAYVGRPVVILGGGGPNAGARALTAEKYLVMKMQVRNRRTVQFMASYVYAPPEGSQVRLTDEKGNRFDWCYSDAAAEAGTVVAQELAADPKRKWRFRDEPANRILDPGASETYLLVFSADHLGKGTRLFLSLPNRVFGDLKYDQNIRMEQKAVEPLPTEPAVPPSDPKPPATVGPGGDKPMPPADPATNAKVAALVTQLAKGKTAADRVKAADELAKLGEKAKAASAPLVNGLFDPSTQVRLTALDALKKVNPTLHGPVVALVTPLTEFDFVGFNPRDRLPHAAVAALAKLGAEGKAAVPVLVFYKREISRPGGWPYVPAVVNLLAALGADEPVAVAALVQGLTKDADAGARLAAAQGLSRVKPTKEVVAVLAAALRGDPESEVRLAAVTALAKYGADAKAALKSIEAAKMDPDPRVREAARDALDKIK